MFFSIKKIFFANVNIFFEKVAEKTDFSFS